MSPWLQPRSGFSIGSSRRWMMNLGGVRLAGASTKPGRNGGKARKELVNVLENSERKERRDAAKNAAKLKVVHLGSEYDLAEGDEGYRLAPREGYFDDKGYF